MKPWAMILAAALLLSVAVASASPLRPEPAALPGAETNHPFSKGSRQAEREPLACLYYQRDSFLAAVTATPAYQAEGRLRAGMIPHHLVASDMIAGFFALAAQGEYDRVVLVSTSHYPQLCGSHVVTAAADWETPHGLLPGDDRLPAALLADPLIRAENNPAALERDHGVAGLVPFVRYYLPQARVTAMLLSTRLEEERLEAVTALLQEAMEDDRTLFVASVDCSHYLMPEEAARRDEQTKAAIEGGRRGEILRFGDANVDSPQTVALLLCLTRHLGLPLLELDHGSAAEKLSASLGGPAFQEGITTYFVYAAVDGEADSGV